MRGVVGFKLKPLGIKTVTHTSKTTKQLLKNN